jgi:hypothetical protein
VQPGDFAENGLLLTFNLSDDRLPSAPQPTATTRHLPAFHLSLYADLQLSATPSDGLRQALHELIAEHVKLLDALSETTVGKPAEAALKNSMSP